MFLIESDIIHNIKMAFCGARKHEQEFQSFYNKVKMINEQYDLKSRWSQGSTASCNNDRLGES